MIIENITAKAVNDSRGEKTIEVSVKTNVGKFVSSAPNGKSKGKHESKSYKKSLEEDIVSLEKLSEYFSQEHLEKFEDLKHVESLVKGHIGANTLFALESAVLKAIAKEQNKQVWELLNSEAKKIPVLIGNCIGGGVHSKNENKPDFQEFLIIGREDSMIKNFSEAKKTKESAKIILKKNDSKFKGEKNDEDAWKTTLTDKGVLEILEQTKNLIGLDVASSSFYKRKKYHYKNPPIDRVAEEQLMFLSNLVKNFKLKYLEDPFEEEDFGCFAKILEKHPETLIVGDDLTVTNIKRVKKAIEKNSINAMIIKPNQNGSLLEVAKIVKLCEENNIKKIFSHRSGETSESILADLAFGFQADYIKCGITGKVREAKINRMIEIEKSLRKTQQ